MDPAITDIFGLADKIGVISIGILLALGIHKQWIVPGWLFKQVQAEADRCATRSEARLDKLESERDKRIGPPAQ